MDGGARPALLGASAEACVVPVVVDDPPLAPAWGSILADCGELLHWLTSTLTLTADESSLQLLLDKARQAYGLRPDWSDASPSLLQKLHTGELLDVDWDRVQQDENLVRTTGLDSLLHDRANSLRYMGLRRPELEVLFDKAPDLHRDRRELFFELMDFGQLAIMLPEFEPNGGVSFTQGMKYRSHQYLCAHEIATRQREGRMVVFRASGLPTLKDLHFSRLTTAPKFQSVDRVF